MTAILRKALIAVSIAGLVTMVGALFMQVLAREFKMAVDWTEELARFSFIGMVFIAAAYDTLTRSHLRVSVFSDFISGLIGSRFVNLFHTVILLGFSIAMAIYSWLNFVDGLRYPNISPALRFNQNHLFLFMCAGFAIIFLLHLRDLWILVRGGSIDE